MVDAQTDTVRTGAIDANSARTVDFCLFFYRRRLSKDLSVKSRPGGRRSRTGFIRVSGAQRRPPLKNHPLPRRKREQYVTILVLKNE